MRGVSSGHRSERERLVKVPAVKLLKVAHEPRR